MIKRIQYAWRFILSKLSNKKYTQYLYSKETYKALKRMSKNDLIRIIINQQVDLKKLTGGFTKK